MKRHVIGAGIAGAALLSAFAPGAVAQNRYYPDGTNCSLLDDAELVACQNQIYARQLQSGASAAASDPASQNIIPSSNIGGAHLDRSDNIVPGAESDAPVASPPTHFLPGPEGTAISDQGASN